MHRIGSGQDSGNPSRCGSRSESMDHGSSRSSSIRSGNSNSSYSGCSSTSTSIAKKIGGYTERDLSRNHFHAHPTSPRPRIWPTTAPPGNGGGRGRRSTAWGLFRPGLVRTPEMELHDLKQKVRNRNRNSDNSTSNIKNEAKKKETKSMKPTRQKTKVKMFDGFTSSCKCSAIAVEPVPSRVAMKKVGNGSVRVEKQVKEEEEGKQLQKQGKQAMAHRRTFEWLKQLSLADLQEET